MPFVLEAVGMSAAMASAVSTGVSVLTSVMGAFQQMQAGDNAMAMARYNAQIAQNNASAAEQVGQQEAGRLYDVNRRRLGTARATQGASGADINLGSPVDVMADLAGQAALDEEIARWRGKAQASGYQNQAQSELYQGRVAQSTAQGRAGTMLLTGFGRLAGLGGGGGGGGGSSPFFTQGQMNQLGYAF